MLKGTLTKPGAVKIYPHDMGLLIGKIIGNPKKKKDYRTCFSDINLPDNISTFPVIFPVKIPYKRYFKKKVTR